MRAWPQGVRGHFLLKSAPSLAAAPISPCSCAVSAAACCLCRIRPPVSDAEALWSRGQRAVEMHAHSNSVSVGLKPFQKTFTFDHVFGPGVPYLMRPVLLA